MGIYAPIQIYGDEPTVTFDRNEWIKERVKDWDVLHVGCTDYPMTKERLKSGHLLHEKIRYSAELVKGIDLDHASIELMNTAGFNDVSFMDAEAMTFKDQFDIVLAGDVVEHLSNPGKFFEGAAKALRDNGVLIVAVPSALSLAQIKAWIFNREDVHKDHVAYYSPKTLAEAARREGFLPVGLTYTVQSDGEGEGRLFRFIRNMAVRMIPQGAPSIIMEFKLERFIRNSDSRVVLR